MEEGNEINDEIVFATQFHQDVGLLGGASNDYRNMSHVYWLNQYDTEVGMARNIEYGRPFRRMMITDLCLRHSRPASTTQGCAKAAGGILFYSHSSSYLSSYKWTAQELPLPSPMLHLMAAGRYDTGTPFA